MSGRSHRTYWFLRCLCWAILRVFFRMRVRGLEQVPRTGGCLLASNHSSFLDPPVLGSAVRHRLVHFMANAALFRKPVLDRILPRMAVIPVGRGGGDMGALRTALRVLRKGGLVAIFPEGMRSADNRFLPPQGGVGFLIARTGVPVIPIYIEGTWRAWPRHRRFPRPARIAITFGAPIRPEEIASFGTGREAFEPIARHVMDRIAALARPKSAV